ncbi:MAG: hypothetical protein EA384_07650 [Spirochaetaceae bacterium]|nr:MAG: hypothetical protein EA384_07650 [Spirochaetaceae bacterium]
MKKPATRRRFRHPKRRTRAAIASLGVGSVRIVAVVAGMLFGSGCNLLTFPDAADIRYHPSDRNQVLARGEHPYVEFGQAVDRQTVEPLLSLRYLDETVPARLAWHGSQLALIAEPELVIGRRYRLRFHGTFRDRRGIDHRVTTTIPFYYASSAETAPLVRESIPASGSDIAPDQQLLIRFSKPMAREQTIRGLSLRPSIDYRTSWNPEQTELIIEPQPAWGTGTSFTLTLNAEVSDTRDVPIERPVRLTFQVHAGAERPRVVGLESIAPDLDNEPPLAGPGYSLLEPGHLLGPDSAIRVTFSRPMDRTATERAFTLVPPVAGRIYWPAEDVLVFVPAERYQHSIRYAVSVSNLAADSNGSRLIEELWQPVQLATAELRLRQIVPAQSDGPAIEEFSEFTARPLTPGLPPHYPYSLQLRFSQPFRSDQARLSLMDRLSLRSLLPGSFSDPFPVGYSWISDTTVSITYHQLTPSLPRQRNYLLLSIPGGAGGVRTDGGSAMAGDVRQLFVIGESP